MAPAALTDVIKIPERISHPQDDYGTGEVLNNIQWLPLPCVPVLTPPTVFPNVPAHETLSPLTQTVLSIPAHQASLTPK